MYAYSNILAALLERAKTGVGKAIDISLLESMVEWMGFPLYYAYDSAVPPPRAGAAHATIYPYGPFVAGDGKTVMLGLQNEREWVVFCEQVLRQPALATDERFVSNSMRSAARTALRPIITAAFAPFSAAQVIERLDAAGIANAQMNDMRDVWTHPQLAARKRWVEVDTSAGPVLAPLPPGAVCGTTPDAKPRMDPVPALGQHTDAILGELGYDGVAIAALRAAKAV